MEAQTEAYLLYLRSLRRDGLLRDGDVPDGYECCSGVDCRCGEFVDDNLDSVHSVRYT